VDGTDEPTGAPEEDGAPPHGTALVRTGFHQIGTGLVDETRTVLDRLRRFLPRRMKTLRTRRLAVILLVALVVVVVAVVAVATAVATGLGGPTAVVVATAGPAVVNSTPGGVGALSASPQHVAVVSLNVQGVTAPIEVTAVDVLAGEQVTAGTPLLQLNPQPFEQNLLQVEASLQQAQATLASAEAEAKSGPGSAGSGSAYLAVQVPLYQGEVNIDQQLVQIAEGNTTSLDAPIAGNISYVRVAAGQIITPGTSLVQIIDPTVVDVSTGMQLSSLQSISPGDPATVTPTELPGVHLHGKVLAVSASAANGGLEGTVVVSVTNQAGHPVPIGTQAFVTVTAPVDAAVAVPSVAVQNIELNPAVAVIGSHNRVTFQSVTVGASDTQHTQILSGLHPGERIAISNLQMLSNGDQVKASSGSP
jgi:RND family efflux transporter MFP subunit